MSRQPTDPTVVDRSATGGADAPDDGAVPESSPGPRRPSLRGLRLALVGPGTVGRTLAAWLEGAGAELVTAAARHPSDHRDLPIPVVSPNRLESGEADLLLLAVPGSELAPVSGILAQRPQAPIALHTCGSSTAEALEPLRSAGSSVGSLHPLRAFPEIETPLEAAAGTFFAIDGDPDALALSRRIATALGGTSAVIPADARSLYHLAATLAAGGVVALVAAAIELGTLVGAEAAAPAFLDLARGALDRTDPAAPGGAITGPVARGETAYLDQLDALADTLPTLRPLAVTLALETLRHLPDEATRAPGRAALRERLEALCRRPDFLDPVSGRML